MPIVSCGFGSGHMAKLAMLCRFKMRHRDRSVRLATEGLEPKPFHGRMVMLVNEHTASAQLERATQTALAL